MTNKEYEAHLCQCWTVPGDEVLSDLSIKECLELERQALKFEMNLMDSDNKHWLGRLNDYLDYVS